MANIEKFIPHLLRSEAGVQKQGATNQELFELARKTGWSDDPLDKGGQTMIGVTKATFADYRKKKGLSAPTSSDLRNISYADWLAILKTGFWDKWKADDIANQYVANVLVDWLYNSGVAGIRIPQQMVGVTADGIVGPKTIAAVNKMNQNILFYKLIIARLDFYYGLVKANPSQEKFLKGWSNRVNSFTFTL